MVAPWWFTAIPVLLKSQFVRIPVWSNHDPVLKVSNFALFDKTCQKLILYTFFFVQLCCSQPLVCGPVCVCGSFGTRLQRAESRRRFILEILTIGRYWSRLGTADIKAILTNVFLCMFFFFYSKQFIPHYYVLTNQSLGQIMTEWVLFSIIVHVIINITISTTLFLYYPFLFNYINNIYF